MFLHYSVVNLEPLKWGSAIIGVALDKMKQQGNYFYETFIGDAFEIETSDFLIFLRRTSGFLCIFMTPIHFVY